jgi:hypothetical protein
MKKTLALALIAAAQIVLPQDREWHALQRLTPGERVGVLLRDHKYVQGRFRSWSPEQIDIARGEQLHSLRLGDVRTVTVQRKGSRVKAAGIGALIGFGAAFPFGAASAGYITDRNNPSVQTRMGMGAGFGLFGGGIGAAIGALAGGTRNVTLYREARKP